MRKISGFGFMGAGLVYLGVFGGYVVYHAMEHLQEGGDALAAVMLAPMTQMNLDAFCLLLVGVFLIGIGAMLAPVTAGRSSSPAIASPQSLCPHCHKPVSRGSTICPYCANSLSGEAGMPASSGAVTGLAGSRIGTPSMILSGLSFLMLLLAAAGGKDAPQLVGMIFLAHLSMLLSGFVMAILMIRKWPAVRRKGYMVLSGHIVLLLLNVAMAL